MHKTYTIGTTLSSKRRFGRAALGVLLTSVAIAGGCGGDDNNKDNNNARPEQTGAACASPAECYPNVDQTMLSGEVRCLSQVRDGYCTHVCATDMDCCKVQGECKTDLKEVCAPFTSVAGDMCFLSCESGDLRDANGNPTPDADPQEYCQRAAGSDFECRASGGGDPRKICMPYDCSVGADCAAVGDCASGLECITAFEGGYCGKGNCMVNADCPDPQNDACVTAKDGKNYCFKKCGSNGDCTLCRDPRWPATCTDQVTFAEAGTTGSVCVP